MLLFLIPAVAVAAAALLLFPMMREGVSPNAVQVRRRVLTNAGFFLAAAFAVVFFAVSASAAPAETAAAAATAAEASGGVGTGLGYLSATGLSCLGAGIAIASTAPAAIGAFSEDPKAFGKALIFVVLGEGVALYGLLVSILLINKL